MKNISLIKQMNEAAREQDPFEKALKEAGIEFDMGDGETEEFDNIDAMDTDVEQYDDDAGMYANGLEDEIERLADAYRGREQDRGQGSADEMSDDELRDSLGNDLEMLEYSPEDVEAGINAIMDLLGRGDTYPDEEKSMGVEDSEYFNG